MYSLRVSKELWSLAYSCFSLGIFCLENGAIINAKVAPYKGKGANEYSMLRAILDTFKEGDLVIDDAFYSSYRLMAYLQMPA